MNKSKSRTRRVKSTGCLTSSGGAAAPTGDISTIAPGQGDAMEEYLKGAKPRLITRVQHEGDSSHLTPFIAETDLGWDEVLDEGYDPDHSPLGPVYWRIVRRGSERFYFSTFVATREVIVKAWGVAGLAHCDPFRGTAPARIETHLPD